MICPKCRTENPDDRKFCYECGSNLLKICPECGRENLPRDKFCGECGQNLTQPSESPPKELSFDDKVANLQRFLPGGLTEKVLSQRGKIEGERKQVTVMFADMENFMPLVENLGSEKAYGIMDEVYEILIHKVHNFEGTVNEMTGDGVMALFGAPIAMENAPQRAIQSALNIHRELAKFNDHKKSEGLETPIKMRIGIHTGPVVVGTLGNDLRVEFKAVGDTVNIASRVEELAGPGNTYITDNTFKLTEGLFRFESLGEKDIKGKEHPITVYRVIAPSTLSTRFEVSAERGLTPFVGRERELELLLDGFERVKSGRGQAFSIIGEAGVGKSRLLYEFRKAIANENVTIRESRCLSYSKGDAYHPIADILKTNFDIQDGDEDFKIKEKIIRGLENIQVDETSTLSYLLELFSVKDSGIDEAISPEDRKILFIEALKKIALKGSEIRPVIMAIEDLHWIDKSSEEVIRDLFENVPGSRILLIFTYRPEFNHIWSTKSYHNQITLNRLLNRESLMMVYHLLGSSELDGDMEELILEKTEGVPFFIEELIKSLKDLNFLEKKDNRYYLKKDAKDLTIPSIIQDVIMARVDPLPEGVKEVLQTGSVIEREFSYSLIRQVTGLSEQELLAHLSVLKDSELVYERGIYPHSSYIFRHALTREVVYDSILNTRKKRLHAKIGDAIEKLYSERLEEFYEILAYHYCANGNPEKAYKYLKLSADKALSIYAYSEAVKFLEQALKIQEMEAPDDREKRCDLLIALCESLLMAGEPRRLLESEANEVLSLAENIEDNARASRICYLAMEALRYYGGGIGFSSPEAVEWAERADRYAESYTKERAWADMAMGVIKYATGYPTEGVTLLNRALELARRLGNADTFWSVAGCWVRYVEAPQHAKECMQLVEEMMARSRNGVSMKTLYPALSRICYAYLCWGQRQHAETILNEVRGLSKRTGQANFLLLSMFLDTIFTTLDGRLEDALDKSRNMVSRGYQLGLPEYAVVHAGLAGMRPRLYLGLAERTLQRTVESEASLPIRVLCLAYLGRDVEVSEALEQLVLERANFGSPEDETASWADILLLEASNLVKHREASTELLKRLSGSKVRTSGPYYTTVVDRHLGIASVLLKKYDEARDHYHTALEVAKDMNFRPEVALTHFHISELLYHHFPDERKKAFDHLDFAIADFHEMRMEPTLQLALKYKDLFSP
ncbi:MAG: AAA family ATPase [Desulfobacteraceae bacterium]|nr:AAA family ATPase [Desulfobacteraceae bacterium]